MTWQVGDELPPLTKGPITRQHIVEWCAAENDYYNLHYDEREAPRLNLSGSPVQGTYKLAMFGLALERWSKGRGWIRDLSIAYRRPDFEPATLTVRGRVTAVRPDGQGQIIEVELWVESEAGERTADGKAILALRADS